MSPILSIAFIIGVALLPAPGWAESETIITLPWGSPENNGIADGIIDLANAHVTDIELPGRPAFVTGLAAAGDVVWVVALESGDIYLIQGDSAVTAGSATFGTLPVMILDSGEVSIFRQTTSGGMLPSHRLPLLGPDTQVGLAIDRDGAGGASLYLDGEEHQLSASALIDTIFARSNAGTVAYMVSPTTRYGHGILGDRIEAGAVAIVDIDTAHPFRSATKTVVAPGGKVFETIAPIFAEVDDIPGPELLLTASDAISGAGIVVYSTTGVEIAQSDPIGRGNRWLHLLSSGRFGPAGEIEVVSIQIPHIGGILMYHRLAKNRLTAFHNRRGYSTHRIGSRNLWMFAAGDFDGDNILEIIVPTQNMAALHVVKRTSRGSEIVAEATLPGRLATNIGSATVSNGHLEIAVGTEGNLLRIYSDHR